MLLAIAFQGFVPRQLHRRGTVAQRAPVSSVGALVRVVAFG